jgi:hypothetical protein
MEQRKRVGPFNEATQLRCTNERVTMAEPDMHASVGGERLEEEGDWAWEGDREKEEVS